ncbi:MAG: hypothetical protein QMD04_10685 [Anaerolineales bacterium]|nr:hypothetical protein [Anaerolineales bacterium]
MNYQTGKQKRLFFDLETTVNPENIVHMPEPEAPANLKDPEKIAAAIEAKRLEQIERAALDPDYGKILSLGFTCITGDAYAITVIVNRDVYFPNPDHQWLAVPEYAATEGELLEIFWREFAACGGCCIGYNILGFDLPYILRRSFALGVKPPFVPNLAKFRTEPITDLMMILYNWGSDRYKSLKLVARLYDLPVEAEGVDGSMVASLSVDELIQYTTSDVNLVVALYERMNGIYFKH